jgi:hypothetical protein
MISQAQAPQEALEPQEWDALDQPGKLKQVLWEMWQAQGWQARVRMVQKLTQEEATLLLEAIAKDAEEKAKA